MGLKAKDLIIVSVDDHIVEPPDMFKQHVPAQLKDKAPKYVIEANGDGYWSFEVPPGVEHRPQRRGRPSAQEYGMEPTAISQMREGSWNVHARIDDMNVNGVLGSLNFGTFPRLRRPPLRRDGGQGSRPGHDPGLQRLALRRLVRQQYPGRFIPMGILPTVSIDATLTELKRLVKLRLPHHVFPGQSGAGRPAGPAPPPWEPLWKLCEDEQVVLSCHIGTGAARPRLRRVADRRLDHLHADLDLQQRRRLELRHASGSAIRN